MHQLSGDGAHPDGRVLGAPSLPEVVQAAGAESDRTADDHGPDTRKFRSMGGEDRRGWLAGLQKQVEQRYRPTLEDTTEPDRDLGKAGGIDMVEASCNSCTQPVISSTTFSDR